MASTHRDNSKHRFATAPDILGKSQNWVQKVSSIRLSNIRVGRHFTNLLTDNDNQQKSTSNNTFQPSFCKILKIRHGGSLVFVGGKNGVRIWLTSSVAGSHADYSTDILYEDSSAKRENACVDLCFSEHVDHNSAGHVVVYLLLSSTSGTSTHCVVRSSIVSGDFSLASSQLPQVDIQKGLGDHLLGGTANSIACTKRFLLVSQTSTGTVQLLCRRTFQKIGEIPSLGPRRAVVLASSARWIAIQTSQESIVGTHSGQQGNQQRHVEKKLSGVRGVPDMGEAARKVVSGLYSLSQVVSWQVSPIISAAVQHSQGQRRRSNSAIDEGREKDKLEEVVGGGVLVMDLGHAVSHDDKGRGDGGGEGGEGGSVDVAVRAHFAAHSSTLGCMAFSPTGLKLASADCFGQVVLVHSLVPSGLLSRAHPVIAPSGLHYCGDDGVSSPPQLLFKLVRGVSLSSIIDIGFACDESVVFASTVNGTVHVFDLDQLSALDSASQGHSHGSSLASHSSFKSGNSLTNGGYGSLEQTSLLLSPPSSTSGSAGGSTGTPSHATLLTMAAGSVSESAFHQYGIPSADVTQFLSLRRPDLRVLQGYSDLRVKLPLSDINYQQQQEQNGIGESRGEDEGATGGARTEQAGEDAPGSFSYYPQEVNLLSSSVLYPMTDAAVAARVGTAGGQGSGNRGNFELLACTSEGLLSRYHLTLSGDQAGAGGSGMSAVLSSMLPSQFQTSKELNRWDLCAALVSSGRGQGSGSQQGQGSRHRPGARGGDTHEASDFSAWMYAASDAGEPLVTPLWMRPQVKLFTFDRAGGSKKSSKSDLLTTPMISNDANVTAVDHGIPYDDLGDDSMDDNDNDTDEPPLQTGSSKKNKKKKLLKPKKTNNSNAFEHVSKTEENGPEEVAADGGVSRLFFPERLPSTLLNITRPSTFVCAPAAMQQYPGLDTGVMLEQYIQTALGDSFSDAQRGATPISIPIIKHARPPEDISAWQMDDWGEEEDEEDDESGQDFGWQGPQIRAQKDC